MPGEPLVRESRLTYLSTDHLGTPVLASTTAGELLWSSGFEPFGTDDSGDPESEISLRLPGQWSDPTWEESTSKPDIYAHDYAETIKFDKDKICKCCGITN